MPATPARPWPGCLLVAIALLLAGCASPTPPAAPTPAAAPPPGDACTPTGAGSVRRTFTVEGATRTVALHVPDGITAPRPAVLAFPGRGESAEQLEGYSGLDATPAVVVYLQGLTGRGGPVTWEATPYLTDAAHDYDFTADVIGWLQRAPCVDRTRIDLTGKSDGAGFAASAACSLPGIAAVATVSGAFYGRENHCAPTGTALSLLDVHGSADPVIPAAGDAARGLLSTDAWLALWRARDRCPAPVVVTTTALRQETSTCVDGTTVVGDLLAGGGHTWPGATTPSGPGVTSRAVDATTAMTSFFADHPLRP